MHSTISVFVFLVHCFILLTLGRYFPILITCLNNVFNLEMIYQYILSDISNYKYTDSSRFDNISNKTVKTIKPTLTAPLYLLSLLIKL